MAVTDSPGPGRMLVALSDGPLVPEPTWTSFDDDSLSAQVRCYGFDCQTGRASEFDIVERGEATVYFHDRVQFLDDSALIGCQVMLQLYNPVTEEWHIRWRGHIDDIKHDLVDAPGFPFANVQVLCVGIFDYLGNCKMIPGVFGDPSPIGDTVLYEDGQRFDDRCNQILDDAGIDIDMRVTFTGNTFHNETQYDPDDNTLVALRDCCDGEFVGLANVYEDRVGRVAIHGRRARLAPEEVATEEANWDWNQWSAATREDVVTGVAQIREFSFNRPRKRIINAFLAYPRADENGVELDRSLIPTLQRTDPTSIGQYGYQAPIDAPDLTVQAEYPASGGRTGTELCGLVGDFYIANYSESRKAIENVVLTSIPPDDARAAATWDLMCRADISDAMILTVDEAQLADEAFFIDGISVECRVANPNFDMVSFTPNLTPRSYYATDVFDA